MASSTCSCILSGNGAKLAHTKFQGGNMMRQAMAMAGALILIICRTLIFMFQILRKRFNVFFYIAQVRLAIPSPILLPE
jgi:hypothetical protein